MSWDINSLRAAATLLAFMAFCLLVWRTWRRSAKPEHDSAQALPFLDDGAPNPRAEAHRE